MKKNVVIDGDKFQKEYKKQYKKELITDLVLGVILIIIASLGLFLDSKLLLKLVVYIFPLFVLTYSINLFSLGIGIIKKHRSQAISFFLQAFIYAGFAIYILFNPLETLDFILVVIGGIIIANAIIKMIYFPNYLPIGSILGGILLIVFSELLINVLYNFVMIFVLLLGISKISKFIYSIKNK